MKAIAEPAVRREIPSEANCSDVRLAGSVVRRATTWMRACGIVSVFAKVGWTLTVRRRVLIRTKR